MTAFDVQVKAMIPADQFKVLCAKAKAHNVSVSVLLAEVVRRALSPPPPPPPPRVKNRYNHATPEALEMFDTLYARRCSDAAIGKAIGMSANWVFRHRTGRGLPPVGRMTHLERERLTPLADEPNTITAAPVAGTRTP